MASCESCARQRIHMKHQALFSLKNKKKKKRKEKTCPMLQFCLAVKGLTLKAPITTAADNIHKYFFIVFQGK